MYRMIINNYWMRLSMISWITKTEACVICRSRRLRQIIQTRGFDNSWCHAKTKFNKLFHYSFKILSCFWLVKTTRIIHHNQLLFTKFGKNLHHIESMTSKVESTKLELLNQWCQNDVKSAARRRLLNRWPRKPRDKVVLYSLSGKTKSVMAKLI